MLATVIVAVVLLLLVAETVRGLVKWRSGGQRDALLALGGAIPCVAYLIRSHVSEYFLLTFLLVGLTAAWGGFLVVVRRSPSAASRSRRSTNGNTSGGKRLLLAVLAADVLAIVLIVTAIGHAALVIGSFVVVNLIAVALSRKSHRSASASDSRPSA